jgi:hypothetical protein
MSRYLAMLRTDHTYIALVVNDPLPLGAADLQIPT